MEHLPQVIRTNQQWIESLFSAYPEVRQIRDEFSAYREEIFGPVRHPRIVTGHQPVIYYPGLLFKDHFVGEQASRLGGSAWNFIVDTDRANLEMPIPYYDEHGNLAKKITGISNDKNQTYSKLRTTQSSVERLLQTIQTHLSTHPHPEIQSAFKGFEQQLHTLLEEGMAFTDALPVLRNRFNAALGYRIKDHKISQLASSYPYAHYVWYIIKHIELYTSKYNAAVKENKNKDYQPVKFLQQQNGWYELPFWMEKQGSRLPVSIYKDAQRLIFRPEGAVQDIEIYTASKGETAIIQNIRDCLVLYPKATSLTQIIRLFLSDIFVHGNGAVEYEQVNNTFLKKFFSMDSRLSFYSVTGDLYLPLTDRLPDLRNLQKAYKSTQKWLRQVERSPEDYLDDEMAETYKHKKKTIAQQMAREKSPDQRKKHHQQLEQLDGEMKDQLAGEIEQARKKLNHYEAILQKKDILYERHYPYFLYPDEVLTRKKLEKNIRISKHG